jgi:hypothetical protein
LLIAFEENESVKKKEKTIKGRRGKEKKEK